MNSERDPFELPEEDPWYKGPIKIVLAVFLTLLLVLWVVPQYAVKLDPEPKYIPEIEEVVPSEISLEGLNNTIENRDDFRKFITPTDPVVKQTADRIVTKACDGSSKICYSKAIFYFIRDKFQYVNDPLAFEYVKTTKESLVTAGGDCDDASVAAASLLQAVGIRTRFVFIPRHVYIQAYLPEALSRYKQEGDWVNLDLTCSNCEFGEIPISNINKQKRYLE